MARVSLIACLRYFRHRRWKIGVKLLSLELLGISNLLVILPGNGNLSWGDGLGPKFQNGECWLVPAGMESCAGPGALKVLRTYVPI